MLRTVNLQPVWEGLTLQEKQNGFDAEEIPICTTTS
ncbi:hypothetical protein HRbin15_02385 [bacterium HR15]|nr:hypothetical protein HRbin15_02385 [bacterium HR15]